MIHTGECHYVWNDKRELKCWMFIVLEMFVVIVYREARDVKYSSMRGSIENQLFSSDALFIPSVPFSLDWFCTWCVVRNWRWYAKNSISELRLAHSTCVNTFSDCKINDQSNICAVQYSWILLSLACLQYGSWFDIGNFRFSPYQTYRCHYNYWKIQYVWSYSDEICSQ